MTKPTIHLNGDSATSLTETFNNAHTATMEALEAILLTAPHGRNFYPQGDEALHKALDEHISRIKRLNDVAEELQELAIHSSTFIK